MSKKYLPPELIELEKIKDQLTGNSQQRREVRANQLYKVISKLYIRGWYFDQVLEHFSHNNLFNSEARSIAAYIYTHDRKYNPFGYWYIFDYLLPIQVLYFTTEVIKDNSLRTAGFIFALLLLDEPKKLVKEKLESEIERTSDPNIKKMLSSFRNKQDLLYLEKPSVFLNIADIARPTRKNKLELIKRSLIPNITIYFQTYSWGSSPKTRMWISDYKGLVDAFKCYRNENRSFFKELKNGHPQLLSKGGISIFDIEQKMRENSKSLSQFLLTEAEKLSDDVKKLSYYKNCIKQKSNKNLSRLYKSYENTFKYDKYGYLNQIPVKTNPVLRVFIDSRKLFIACQRDFLSYKLLLSSLYGNIKELNINKDRVKPLKLIRKVDSPELIKKLVNIKLKLIISGVGSHLHPISNPDKPRRLGCHFKQIKEVSNAVDNMSNTGIKIDTQRLREMRSFIKKNKYFANIDLLSVSDSFLSTIGSHNDEDKFQLTLLCKKIYENNDTFIKYRKYLKVLLRASNNIQTIKNGRIFGQFTPHGANTHRMTSRKINIQGIPKSLKNTLFIAKDNRIILSADISGQDFAIAASIAHRISMDNSLNIEKNLESYQILKEKYTKTLGLITNNTQNPIDHLVNLLEDFIDRNANLKSETLKIRDSVKTILYTTFYGGNPSREAKKRLKEELEFLFPLRDQAIANYPDQVPDKKVHIERLRKINKTMSIYELLGFWMGEHFFYEAEIKQIEKCKQSLELKQFLDSMGVFMKPHIRMDSIVKRMRENLKKYYPGILESFDILSEYTKNHPDRLTYPTLLGWQTVIDKKPYNNPKDIATRSKSYPIQASGAEFIREWILQLTKTDLYKKKKLKIIAAIHDQLLIEVPYDEKELAEKLLISTKNEACNKIGLEPQLMRIPRIDYITDKKV